jgi:hypothetical protein
MRVQGKKGNGPKGGTDAPPNGPAGNGNLAGMAEEMKALGEKMKQETQKVVAQVMESLSKSGLPTPQGPSGPAGGGDSSKKGEGK